ncbi:helix-turn-helix domain-containing protein [Paenibacillus sp. sgz500992]|uniref:response regulator transcription factor n=1 Tax=Paenibacillus sp. sgz500992 TaxID=3242476 RepID=UPI0036D29861
MKLLIADDDDYTRLGLLESVDWKRYGIETIREARDGAEALREAIDLQPDLVITDIRMPKLNGIEFAEKLMDRCKHSKLLFMSGYMEVEYLKSAIKLSAVDYIEKPIKLPDLEHAVMKAVESIRAQREQQIVIGQKLELQRQSLARKITSKEVNISELVLLCKEVAFPANSHYVCIVSAARAKNTEADHTLKPEMIQAFWDAHHIPSLHVQEDQNKHLTVLAFKKNEVRKVQHLCSQFLHQYDGLIMGMGEEARELKSIGDSHQTANRALERSFFHREQRFFGFEAKNQPEPRIDLYPEFFTILKNNLEELPVWLDFICDKIKQAEFPKKERVCELFHSFAQTVFQERASVISRLSHACCQGDVEKAILESSTIDELHSILSTLITAYIEDLQESTPYSGIVREVIKYIAAHCSKVDLDIREISDHVHMSTSHMGLLFKNETGLTIRQYIGDYRLEHAKKMILDEHYKINTIAERCGYASPSYFTKVFRAATNHTPLEYRKLMTK